MTDLLIDGNSLYARSWYAVMAKPGGNPNAVVRAAVGTVLSLLNVNTDKLGEKVDRILFGWDGRDKRDKQRAPKPTPYHPTRQLLMEYLTFLFNPAHGSLALHEADDIVATAARQSKADVIFVASGDKDLQQLAGGRVNYYCLNQKSLLSLRSIRDRWHVKQPVQVAVALAIIGDKVDLIQGINGWGKKKVQKLFESIPEDMPLDEVILAIEEQVPEHLRDGFYQDLDLTLLHTDLPGVPSPKPVKLASLDAVKELQLAPDFMEYYRPVYRLYHAVSHADVHGDEEDVPVDA